MFCFHCGRENEAKSKVCRYCGYPLISEKAEIGFSSPDTEYIGPQVQSLPIEAQQSNQKGANVLSDLPSHPEMNPTADTIERRWKDKKLLAGIFSVAVIFVALAIFNGSGQRNTAVFSYISEDALEIFADTNKNTTYVWNTGGEKLFEIDEVLMASFIPDKTAAILLNQENRHRYYVNAGKLIRLREGINMLNISCNGQYLIYTSTEYTSTEEQESMLYRYDVKKEKEELLDRGKVYTSLAISPDGKAMAYSAAPDWTGAKRGDFSCYLIRNGGEPEFFGKKRAIFALSDHAEYIYYCELQENNKIAAYAQKEGQSVYLTNSLDRLLFNLDFSEFIYCLEGSTYLFNGNDKTKIYDSLIRDVIRPKNGQAYGYGVYPGFNSFKSKALIFQDNAVVWIDDKYAARKVGNNIGHYFAIISDTENTLMYATRKLEIEKVTIQGDAEDSKKFVNNAYQVATSGDLSDVYYLSGNQLYYKNNMEEAIMLADDAEGLCLNAKGDIAFFQKDCTTKSNVRKGTLYYSVHGGEPRPVEDGEEAVLLGQWNYGIVFAGENDTGSYDLYYNTKGIEFKLILEDVSFEDIINEDRNFN
jgi:hypothetical protein